jgi:hypothetical protein
VENTLLSIGVKDLYKYFGYIRGQNHEENHHEDRIKLYILTFTISQGFRAKGPGAKVESVPVAKACPYIY